MSSKSRQSIKGRKMCRLRNGHGFLWALNNIFLKEENGAQNRMRSASYWGYEDSGAIADPPPKALGCGKVGISQSRSLWPSLMVHPGKVLAI